MIRVDEMNEVFLILSLSASHHQQHTIPPTTCTTTSYQDNHALVISYTHIPRHFVKFRIDEMNECFPDPRIIHLIHYPPPTTNSMPYHPLHSLPHLIKRTMHSLGLGGS